MVRVLTYVILFILFFSSGCASLTSVKSAGAPPVLTIYVVRHGEAYGNLRPALDLPKEKLDSLTPRGLEQAKRTGEYLSGENIVAVVASPTGRTRETARIIAEEVGLKGVFTENVAFASVKDGKTPDGKMSTFSWRVSQWEANQDPRPEGGESLEDAVNRAIHAVKALTQNYRGKAIAIVTHSDICAGLAGRTDNTPFPQRYKKHSIDFGSVVEIAIGPEGAWKLLRIK